MMVYAWPFLKTWLLSRYRSNKQPSWAADIQPGPSGPPPALRCCRTNPGLFSWKSAVFRYSFIENIFLSSTSSTLLDTYCQNSSTEDVTVWERFLVDETLIWNSTQFPWRREVKITSYCLFKKKSSYNHTDVISALCCSMLNKKKNFIFFYYIQGQI